jgi:hypothetical protein
MSQIRTKHNSRSLPLAIERMGLPLCALDNDITAQRIVVNMLLESRSKHCLYEVCAIGDDDTVTVGDAAAAWDFLDRQDL